MEMEINFHAFIITQHVAQFSADSSFPFCCLFLQIPSFFILHGVKFQMKIWKRDASYKQAPISNDSKKIPLNHSFIQKIKSSQKPMYATIRST